MVVSMEAHAASMKYKSDDADHHHHAPIAGFVATDDSIDMDDDEEVEMESTQQLEDEPTLPTPTKALPTPTPTEAPTQEQSFDFVGASPSSRPFAQAFDVVWRVMQQGGWQTAQGPGTEFVSMPGTQFFNFRPNINVFDSKGKACWKWISLAAEAEAKNTKSGNSNNNEDEETVWETLWAVAEAEYGWYTMSSGNETWFVTPNTSFEKFQPNVTIFQTKKRAVLQSLANEKVVIKLGDSVDGTQVIDFAATPESAAATKAKKKAKAASSSNTSTAAATTTTATSNSSDAGDAFKTPPSKKGPPTGSTSSSKKSSKSTPSSSKKSSSKKASATPNKSPKSAKKSATPPPPAAATKSEPPRLQFHIPEFRCTFGIVYEKLQRRGWHHKAGAFEYDYFSPEYTKDTAVLGGNYFQSKAEFESFLKDSGMWQEIESQLREEHATLVDELRAEAEKKRDDKLAREKASKKAAAATKKAAQEASPSAAKETTPKANTTPRSPVKAKKKATASPSAGVKRKAEEAAASSAVPALPEVKITIGKMVGQLQKRGWTYKPGRFEYDYFKPNVSIKTAKLNEDYFQSAAELETHLKVSGLWSEIAQELREAAQQARDADDDDDSADDAKYQQQQKKKSKPTTPKPRLAAPQNEEEEEEEEKEEKEQVKSPGEVEPTSDVLEPAAVAVTNDIWGNSAQFDFERY